MLTPELLNGLKNARVRFHQLPNGDELAESQYYVWNGVGGIHTHASSIPRAKVKVASFPELASGPGVPANGDDLVATPLHQDESKINGWFVSRK